MAATSYPCQLWGSYEDSCEIREFVVDSGATFKKGELVFWDTSAHTLKGCGADPALIAGIAMASAAFGLGTEFPGPAYQGNRVPVALLSNDALVLMAATAAPTVNNIGVQYGIDKDANNNWIVDFTDTTTKRIVVVDIFNTAVTNDMMGPQSGQEGTLVRFGGLTYLQFSGIF